ncbi:hypothetical protein BKA64DRAFT_680924 [Cadophora sp. MPI-SDFR-AT-0126]|nr:hypothetical protein BKA64DRAFT_680924 [Leotiomycetes sp. MPI-SDFR-AT-0126]
MKPALPLLIIILLTLTTASFSLPLPCALPTTNPPTNHLPTTSNLLFPPFHLLTRHKNDPLAQQALDAAQSSITHEQNFQERDFTKKKRFLVLTSVAAMVVVGVGIWVVNLWVKRCRRKREERGFKEGEGKNCGEDSREWK